MTPSMAQRALLKLLRMMYSAYLLLYVIVTVVSCTTSVNQCQLPREEWATMFRLPHPMLRPWELFNSRATAASKVE